MSENEEAAKSAGVRYPFVNLEKALGRAGELFDADQRGREMTVPGAFGVWNYSEKSSGGFQTIGALIMYGLLKDSGSGDSRKVGLTDEALRYFRDEREEEKKKLARDFALRPKLIAALWQDWHDSPPADTIARSHLKTERGLNDQAARSLLAIYKENLAFAELKGNGKIVELGKIKGSDLPPPNVKVGDYVQWTSDGIDQFKPVRQVVKVEDGHVWVFGSNTGIPMEQVTITDPPAPKPVLPPAQTIISDPNARDEGPSDAPQIDVLLRGNRLQITADVDAAGLAKLKDVLAKYEEILKLLQ
jgi:hypothetical protein